METKPAASNAREFLIEEILRWRNFYGSTVVCQACGEHFDFPHEMGPRPRTCSECFERESQQSGLGPENEERTDRFCEICAWSMSDDTFSKEIAQVCSACLGAMEVDSYDELPDLLHLLRARRFLESLPMPELGAVAGELKGDYFLTQRGLDQSESSELMVLFDYSSEEILYPRDLVLKALAFPLSQEEQAESRESVLEEAEIHQLEPKNESDSVLNRFILKGHFFLISYSGKDLPPLKPTIGLRYISLLLAGASFRRPEDLIRALGCSAELSRKTERYAAMSKEASSPDSDDQSRLEEEEMMRVSNTLSRSQPVIDGKALQELKRERQRLQREIERATDDNDLAMKKKAEEELRQIDDYALSCENLSGKIRSFDSASERARKAVSKAIHSGIELIFRESIKLGSHLHSSLTPIKYPLKYNPPEPTSWEPKT